MISLVFLQGTLFWSVKDVMEEGARFERGKNNRKKGGKHPFLHEEILTLVGSIYSPYKSIEKVVSMRNEAELDGSKLKCIVYETVLNLN